MATEIIELAQIDGNTIGQSEYDVSIPPGTTLYPGDVLSLEKAFLDTSGLNSQKITVAEDLYLDLTVGFYQQQVREDNMDLSRGGADNYVLAPNTSYIDTKTYVLMQESTAGVGSILKGIKFVGNNGKSWTPVYEGWGDFFGWNMTIQYTKVGATQTTTTNVKLDDLAWTVIDNLTFLSGEVTSIQYDPTKPVLMRTMQFNGDRDDRDPNSPVTNVNQQLWNGGTALTLEFHTGTTDYKGDYSFDPPTATGGVPGVASCVPYTRDTEDLGLSVYVPKGNYTETDIAGLINDQLQRDYARTDETLRSAFLFPYDPAVQTNTLWIEQFKAAAFDTTDPLPGGMNGGILVGATQMELSYDDDRGQFLWKYAHSPYLYGSTVAVEAVGFVKTTKLAVGNDKAEVVARNSGVFFTSLRARTVVGKQPVDFWKGELGFDLESLLVKLEAPADTTINLLALNKLQMPRLDAGQREPLQTGVKTTENFPAISMLADPTQVTDWWHLPSLATDYFTTAADQTVPIFAGREDIAQKTDNTGYYLVSVAMKARNRYVGADGFSSGSIIGVVGEFFARNSYTQGTSADAIPYVHTGPPQQLDAFRVKIMGPNKEPSTSLGNRNSLMLRITHVGGEGR